jgi:hypothetical protein
VLEPFQAVDVAPDDTPAAAAAAASSAAPPPGGGGGGGGGGGHFPTATPQTPAAAVPAMQTHLLRAFVAPDGTVISLPAPAAAPARHAQHAVPQALRPQAQAQAQALVPPLHPRRRPSAEDDAVAAEVAAAAAAEQRQPLLLAEPSPLVDTRSPTAASVSSADAALPPALGPPVGSLASGGAAGVPGLTR